MCQFQGFCIFQPLALCLGLGPGPQCVFIGPGPQFVYTGPGPQFVFTGPSPQFVFTGPGPIFVFTDSSLQFYYQSISPQFVFEFTALVYDLYYRSEAWICIYLIINISRSGSCNSSSSNFFGKDNTNICTPIFVN